MQDINLLSSLCLLLVFQKRPWVVEDVLELHQCGCVIMGDMGPSSFALDLSKLGVGLWCLSGARTGVYHLPLSNKKEIIEAT